MVVPLNLGAFPSKCSFILLHIHKTASPTEWILLKIYWRSGITQIPLGVTRSDLYEACPESKDTKVLNVYNIFNLQKRHCE